jgi:1-acyl-sn-glycerol-3-phosphate acyltransferase
MSKIYFEKSTYTTPEGKRKFMDKLFFNTRIYFLLRYIKIILKCRSMSLSDTYTRERWAESSKWIFDLIEECGGTFEIEGIQNINDNKEPVVYIANHMSTLETMVLPSIIAPVKPVTFVVKESLLTFPFFGAIMKARNPIAVGRTNPREDYKTVMTQGEKLLKEGNSIIIFPQSTRSVPFDESNFGSLGVKLAAKAGVKVIPIALKTDFWQKGKYLKDLGPLNRKKVIRFNIGEEMSIEKKGNEEHKAIVKFISTNLEKWGNPVIKEQLKTD